MDPYESFRHKPSPIPVPRSAYGPEVTFPRNTAEEEDSIMNLKMSRGIFNDGMEQETKSISRVLHTITPKQSIFYKPISHSTISTKESARREDEEREKQWLEDEMREQKRREDEGAEQKRLKKLEIEAAERERLRRQQERDEQERLEKIRREQQRIEMEKAERLRQEKGRKERERRERLENERRARECEEEDGPDSEGKDNEENVKMKMYEAQAIAIEKEQELKEKDKKIKEKDVEIEEMKKKIEQLQLEKQNQSSQKAAPIEQSGSVAGGDNAQLSKQVTELKRIVENLKRKDYERNQQMQSMSVFLSSVQAHISRLDGLIISQSGFYSNQEQTTNARIAQIERATNASITQINSQLKYIYSHISQMNAALKQQTVSVVDTPKTLTPPPVKAPNNKKISNAQNQSVANETSILVMRGWERQPAAFIYNSSTEAWQRLGFSLPSEMSSFGVAVVKEEIYIFGGFLKYCFKLENDGSWNRMADMNEERIDIENSSIVYKDQIWVIGGSNSESDELCSVEKYIPSANKWVAMAKTNFPRKHCSTAVLNGKLYVSGGISSAASSIEVFDTEIHKWILFCQMPIEFTGHCMLAFRGNLIFLGGYGMQNYENVYYNNVWKLNPNKQITEISKFTTARGNFGAVNLLNNLMIFGGTSGVNSLYSSEMFDGEKWTGKATLPAAMENVAYTSLSRSLEVKLFKLF